METRNSVKWLLSSMSALAAAFVVGGCLGGDGDEPATAATERKPNIVQGAAPGEPPKPISAEDAAKAGAVEHVQADVDFMRDMIHHHAQALVMTNLARTRAATRDVKLLARRTEISQEAEIEQMEQWLLARDEQPPTDEEHKTEHGSRGSLMPGMLSAEQLEQLADARGAAFDRRFLTSMVGHHQGALEMVATLQAAGGGNEPEIGTFASHVQADQSIEIKRMQELLEVPGSTPARRGKPAAEDVAQATRFAFAGGKPRICVIG